MIALGLYLLVTKYLWLLLGLLGMVGAIIPAIIIGTQIYFDMQLFSLVVGVGFFFMVASCGDKVKRVRNFGTGALSAGSLGFFPWPRKPSYHERSRNCIHYSVRYVLTYFRHSSSTNMSSNSKPIGV